MLLIKRHGRLGRIAVHCQSSLTRPKIVQLVSRGFAVSSEAESTSKSSRGALDGVRILDLSRVLAGPYCTQILADYGADVIKIEDIERGDDTRHFKVDKEDAAWKDNVGPMSNYFAAINRNKRSMCLNLKHEEGRQVLYKLVKRADVL